MNWTILDSSRRRNKKLLALEEEVEHQIEVEADQGEDLPRESNINCKITSERIRN